MATMDRRDVLRALASAPLAAAAITWTDADVEAASLAAQTARQATAQTAKVYAPKFFTKHEWATVGILVDMIIPRDDRSGSATDAAVPEFMDFMMTDQPARQTAMRGGLAWLDDECHKRYDKSFFALADAERRVVLDDISWPRRVKPGMAAGVSFFNSFRDLTASGFFSSKMGVADLKYMGNTVVMKWTGCPKPVLDKLGV